MYLAVTRYSRVLLQVFTHSTTCFLQFYGAPIRTSRCKYRLADPECPITFTPYFLIQNLYCTSSNIDYLAIGGIRLIINLILTRQNITLYRYIPRTAIHFNHS